MLHPKAHAARIAQKREREQTEKRRLYIRVMHAHYSEGIGCDTCDATIGGGYVILDTPLGIVRLCVCCIRRIVNLSDGE